LQEFAWKPGRPGWRFGKAGKLGTVEQPQRLILFGGAAAPKGLSMHPPDTGYTRICYYLDNRAQTLNVKGGVSDDDRQTKPNPTRFVILVDGQVLWRSPWIEEFGTASTLSLDVSQATILELRTFVESGNSTGSHAVWLDPYVVVKK